MTRFCAQWRKAGGLTFVLSVNSNLVILISLQLKINIFCNYSGAPHFVPFWPS